MKYLKYFESKKNDVYIFLDIDGVCIPFDENSNHRYFEDKEKWSKEAITNLNNFHKKYKPNVVIISSYCNEKTLKELQDKFIEMGFKGTITEKLKGQKSEIRFSLVKKYVKENNIDKFVIIDDIEHDIKDVPEIKKNWCRPKSNKGFTKEDLSDCYKMLEA